MRSRLRSLQLRRLMAETYLQVGELDGLLLVAECNMPMTRHSALASRRLSDRPILTVFRLACDRARRQSRARQPASCQRPKRPCPSFATAAELSQSPARPARD